MMMTQEQKDLFIKYSGSESSRKEAIAFAEQSLEQCSEVLASAISMEDEPVIEELETSKHELEVLLEVMQDPLCVEMHKNCYITALESVLSGAELELALQMSKINFALNQASDAAAARMQELVDFRLSSQDDVTTGLN